MVEDALYLILNPDSEKAKKATVIIAYATYAAQRALGSPTEMSATMVASMRASIDELVEPGEYEYSIGSSIKIEDTFSGFITARPLVVFEMLFDTEGYPPKAMHSGDLYEKYGGLPNLLEGLKKEGKVPQGFLMGVETLNKIWEKNSTPKGGCGAALMTFCVVVAFVEVMFHFLAN